MTLSEFHPSVSDACERDVPAFPIIPYFSGRFLIRRPACALAHLRAQLNMFSWKTLFVFFHLVHRLLAFFAFGFLFDFQNFILRL